MNQRNCMGTCVHTPNVLRCSNKIAYQSHVYYNNMYFATDLQKKHKIDKKNFAPPLFLVSQEQVSPLAESPPLVWQNLSRYLDHPPLHKWHPTHFLRWAVDQKNRIIIRKSLANPWNRMKWNSWNETVMKCRLRVVEKRSFEMPVEMRI